MTAYYATGDVEKSFLIAQEISENVSLSESKRNLGALYLLRISMNRLEYDKALLLAESLIENADNQTAAEAAFLIAQIRYKQDDFAASIEPCIILLGKYGLYEQWTDKTYLLLVNNYMASGVLLTGLIALAFFKMEKAMFEREVLATELDNHEYHRKAAISKDELVKPTRSQ